ncbi:MAG: transcriptional regulator [Alphaproteobacteria bacterium]|nr:transcriptional regulator [Alphaproteobacteria bacterium]
MDQEQESFIRRVREEVARRRMTRQLLADQARISLSTLEKALSGERALTLATRLRVEAALGIGGSTSTAPAATTGAVSSVAPPELGAYSRSAVSGLEGHYLTLRPSFETPGAVFAYRTEIAWDDAASCLKFAESARLDAAYAQRGRVSLAHQSGHIYLVTSEMGQYRLAVLGHPGIDGVLSGLLLTLQSRRGAQLVPVATPFALVPLRDGDPPSFGLLEAGHPDHGSSRRRLDAIVEEEFVRFIA